METSDSKPEEAVEHQEIPPSPQDAVTARTKAEEAATQDGDRNAAVAVNNEDSDPPEKVSASTLMAVFFMGLSYVAAISCGLVMPAGIVSQIGTALGDMENIVWIPGGWGVASAVSFSIAGRLSDIFGRRYVLISGQALTLIGSIVGATAHKTTIVAAGSTIIGFGAGVIFVSYPGISELLPNKYRGMGIAWTEFCLNVPWAGLGVLIAQEFVIHASWRWIYYVGIIYAAISMTGTAVSYFPPSRPRGDYDKSRWQEFKELDFVGLFLFCGGLTLFLVGITYLGKSSYSVAVVASTTVIGGLLLAACLAYDFTIARDPIFPLRLFVMFREFTVHLIILFVAGMIWQAITTLGPQGTLYMFTNDPIRIGVLQIPNNISGLLGGWIMPSLVHKIKHVREQILFALLMETVFTACYAAVVPNHEIAWSVMQLFGQSCFTWVTLLAYVSSGLFVPQEDFGVSAGLIGTFRSAGNSVGNAIFSTILTSQVNKQMPKRVAEAAIQNGFPAARIGELIPAVVENAVGVPHAFASIPEATSSVISATSRAFKEAYAYSFRRVFYATIPFGVIALGFAWFVKDPSPLLNNHVAVHQEREILSGKRVLSAREQEHIEKRDIPA
ncbi:efflux pump antibiotic resistance protein, putative [Talaromyces stipitatus ATCC 10500]|uniref:Efflux pump antibiotic resistance protein, putative n=1 Tax=Talaromyces stipitatus (strain ATCC 10500 / CBS 375.48 / QM 6759 / NRRL 1006) TaxID=441959 RepID=B8LV48_TALSN|nr:efflux pump antibiotic resistance protein, putative [Talaromyces stipitatus ATCC 10500]EED23098.1 efflux pump antibiotic resistance protein, putative [Talaromyces stipitatus ATCC 10500]